MSITVTARQILDDARMLAGAEVLSGSEANDFTSDAELLRHLSHANRSARNFVVGVDGGIRWLATSTTLTSPSYTLPSDFLYAAGLDLIDGSSYLTLKPFQFPERNAGGSTQFPRWAIVGNALVLSPSGSTPGSLRLWYVANSSDVTSTASTFPVDFGFSEYLTYLLARRIVVKDERDASELVADIGRLEAGLRRGLRESVIAQPAAVAETRTLPEEWYLT